MDASAARVIRRKVVHIEPIPVPETTYRASAVPAHVPLAPLPSNAFVDGLAQPKATPPADDTLPPIPMYRTDAPA
jgi:hypothetical protein